MKKFNFIKYMDENFENIILDEEDDLDFGVESLREKSKNSHRNNNNEENNKNLNKDVMNLLSNEENHLKPNINANHINEDDENNLSEEYNDFEYNIEDNNIDSGDKSPDKRKNNNNKNDNLHNLQNLHQDDDNFFAYNSNLNEKIDNNIMMSPHMEQIKNSENSNRKYNEDEYINENDKDNYNDNYNDNEHENYNYNDENENENENENDNDNIIHNNINNNNNNNYPSSKEEHEKDNLNEKNENENENEIENNENLEKSEKNRNLVKNSSSMIQMIEDSYYLTKNELENILSKLEFNSLKEVKQQNLQLIEYISKLNSMINGIIKIFPKGEQLLNEKLSKNRRLPKEKETKEEKEKKIVGIYRREYLRLENKYQLINDPQYKESLLIELNKLENEYEKLVEENIILREEQKKNELNIERKTRSNNKEQNEIKRIQMDINNIKSQINLLQKKVDKNKVMIIENNKRINQYVEREKNLDYIAKEKYGIKEYEDIRSNEENKIKMIEDKNILIRKIEIYEKGIGTNKNKYEREIRLNEKIINDLENEKINLIYNYKELIGEEEFQNIIQNFKKENKYILDTNDEKDDKDNLNVNDINEEEESLKKNNDNYNDNDNIINNDNNINMNNNNNNNNNNIIIKDNIDDMKDENLLLLKDNINNNNNINNNFNNKKYPEFLDFFKDEDNNDDINEIQSNVDKNEIKGDEDIKIEKEINIVKFDDMKSLSNKEKEDESPPNEYEDLEEFQI